jgi:hypothetical protein
MLRRRKHRDLIEIQQDPHFPFYVGRLMGASEMISHWLSLQPDPEAQEFGKRLNKIVGWFLTEELEDPEITKILPPPKP